MKIPTINDLVVVTDNPYSAAFTGPKIIKEVQWVDVTGTSNQLRPSFAISLEDDGLTDYWTFFDTEVEFLDKDR